MIKFSFLARSSRIRSISHLAIALRFMFMAAHEAEWDEEKKMLRQ